MCKTIDFIKECNLIHNNRYNYIYVNYINNKTKVSIICDTHGDFYQTPYKHKKGQGCPKCSPSSYRYTKEEIISLFIEKHGDRYDYSSIDYKSNRENIDIICKTHGKFKQKPKMHLLGQGCPTCGGSKALDNNSFINKSNLKHLNLYDYSKVIYINHMTKVIITCKYHGDFTQTPNSHLSGQGCPKCCGRIIKNIGDFINYARESHVDRYNYDYVNYINNDTEVKIFCNEHGGFFFQTPKSHILKSHICDICSLTRLKTTDIFIKNAKEIHGDKYEYNLVEYNGNREKVRIICPLHGEFNQTPLSHIIGKSGCPTCRESKGEKIVGDFLKNNNINFIRQMRFNGCKYKRHLPFDFYLPDYKICVEFDGEQHFRPISRYGGKEGFDKLLIRDGIKNKYCLDNDIELIRISSLDIDDKLEKIKSLTN